MATGYYSYDANVKDLVAGDFVAIRSSVGADNSYGSDVWQVLAVSGPMMSLKRLAGGWGFEQNKEYKQMFDSRKRAPTKLTPEFVATLTAVPVVPVAVELAEAAK